MQRYKFTDNNEVSIYDAPENAWYTSRVATLAYAYVRLIEDAEESDTVDMRKVYFEKFVDCEHAYYSQFAEHIDDIKRLVAEYAV